MPGQQNAPRLGHGASDTMKNETPQITAGPARLGSSQTTVCEHLERATYWLGLAENNWTDAAQCQAAAKLAELHIMLADRVEDLEACHA